MGLYRSSVMVQGQRANRRISQAWLAAACLVVIGLQTRAFAQRPQSYQLADLKALETAFVKLADKVRPSVVAIQSYLVREGGSHVKERVKIPVSRGSGLIIESDGLIVTNRHVLEEANDFVVTLDDGHRFSATVLNTDPRSDLALIRIEATGLATVCFGDVKDVEVNQWAFAVGNPFGVASRGGQMSVSFGVISALGRSMTDQLAGRSDLQYYGNLIETSAAINPGSSGGPLFDIDGKVIGIVTAIETSTGVSEGVGFAIPIDRHTLGILDKLKSGEPIRYGFLGVGIADAKPRSTRRVVQSKRYPGVVLTAVTEGGPADNAGLLRGDILIEYNDEPLRNVDHLIRLVNFTPVDTEATVTFLRKKVKRETIVTIGDRYKLLGLEIPE